MDYHFLTELDTVSAWKSACYLHIAYMVTVIKTVKDSVMMTINLINIKLYKFCTNTLHI